MEQARADVGLLEYGDPCISRARSGAHVECEGENGRALGLLGKPKGDGETSSRLSRSCSGRPTAGKAWIALSDPLVLSVFVFVAAVVASLAIAVEIARWAQCGPGRLVASLANFEGPVVAAPIPSIREV